MPTDPFSQMMDGGAGPADGDSQARAAAAEAEQDAVLQRLEAGESAHEIQRTPTPEVPAEPSTPEAEPETPVAEGEAKQDPETPDAEPTAQTNPEHEAAMAALKRDGFTDAEIEALGEAAVLKIGRKRAKHQTDVDAAYEELKGLKAQQASQDENAGTSVPTEPPPDPTLDQARGKLADTLGAEAAESLVDALSELLAPMRAGLSTATEAAQRAQAENVARQEAEAFTELSGAVPELGDPMVRDEIQREARKLATSGLFQTVGEAVRAATLNRFGQLGSKPDPRVQARANRAKANGSPVIDSKAPQPSKPSTPDELQDRVLSLLEKGHTPAEVRRLVGT